MSQQNHQKLSQQQIDRAQENPHNQSPAQDNDINQEAEKEAERLVAQSKADELKEKDHLKGMSDEVFAPFKCSQKNMVDLSTTAQDRNFAEEVDWIEERGGMEYIELSLVTNFQNGMNDPDEHSEQRFKAFSNNIPDKKPLVNFCVLFYNALNDFTLKILICAAIFSIIVEFITSKHREIFWVEGTAILAAVLIVSIVTAVNDWQKQKKFAELDKEAENSKLIQVLKGGLHKSVLADDVLVGDVVLLQEGMQVPADGIVIEANELSTDESAMTGETDPLKKCSLKECQQKRDEIEKNGEKLNAKKHDVPSPILFSGTNVLTGDGKMVIFLVGKKSALGRIREKIDQSSSEDDETPLQKKLNTIANDIGKFGLISCIIIFIILMIRFTIERVIRDDWWQVEHISEILGYIIICITVIVVAIPEGLPLSVTLSLAFSVKKMLKDKNLVRKLQACETMGGADCICSDKTGTLTENKMNVQMYWNQEMMEMPPGNDKLNILDYYKNEKFLEKQKQMVVVNSSANLRPQEVGNKTEVGFLRFFDRTEFKYEDIRDQHQILKKLPFSSDRKRMSTIIEVDGKHRFLIKGASELILASCKSLETFDGQIIPCPKDAVLAAIKTMAQKALRTIAVAYKPWDKGLEFDDGKKDKLGVYNEELNDFILCGIYGIDDVIRAEVPASIKTCQRAGITVRMVTGDNGETAKAIAVKANLIKEEEKEHEGLVIEGKKFIELTGGVVCKEHKTYNCECPINENDFKNMQSKLKKELKEETDKMAQDEINKKLKNMKVRIDTILDGDKFDQIYKDIRVMARSRPDDKYAMVVGLIERGHVVAVTGDGTNDAPALKRADVGFAMNIAGTQVAKSACDIMLMDDNFSSIVKAILWGRNIYDCIQKFLQFQLTVNVVAVIITLLGAAIIQHEVLTALQMLWVNLIMDTFASLALATEPPVPKLLLRNPTKRDEYIISKKMFKHIIGQSIYQMIVLCIVLFLGEFWVPEYSDDFDVQLFDDWTLAQSTGEPWLIKGDIDEDREKFEFWWMAKYNAEPTCEGNATGCVGLIRSGRLYSYSGLQEEYKFIVDEYNVSSRHFTFIFSLFVFMQVFNFLNARKIKDEWNIFEGVTNNLFFIIIVLLIIVLQIVIILVGTFIFNCYSPWGLHWQQFVICLIFGVIGNFINLLIKLVPDEVVPDFLSKTKDEKYVDDDELKKRSQQQIQQNLQNTQPQQPIPQQQ